MLIRAEIYDVEFILEKIKTHKPFKLENDFISLSKRYSVFLEGNLKCSKCGLQGSFFAKEKYVYPPAGCYQPSKWHLNLYAIKNGKEVLMTKDHIIPKSKGGEDSLDNLQIMCVDCNQQKGNKL